MAFNVIRSTPEEIQKIQLEEQLKIPQVDFDVFTHVFCGDDLDVNEYIHLHNPTVKEVKDFGELKYLHLVNLITMRSYDDCVALDDNGLNYQEISDFDMFIRNIRNLKQTDSAIIFGDLDLSKFEFKLDSEKNVPYLIQQRADENGNELPPIIIDKLVYAYVVTFVRRINYISAKIEFDMGNEIGRKFLLERKRRKQEQAKKGKSVAFESQLSNICSFCCARFGGAYNYETILEAKISQLYDMYRRLNCIDERNDFASSIRTGMMKDADVRKGAYKLNAARNLYE